MANLNGIGRRVEDPSRNFTGPLAGALARRSSRVGIFITLIAATHVASTEAQQPPQRAQQAQQQENLPEGEGKSEFMQNCVACHALGTVTATRRSAQEWVEVIQRMVNQGAQVTSQNFVAIQRYLTANFGQRDSGAAAPVAQAQEAAAQTRPAVAEWPRPSGPNQWVSYGKTPANLNYSDLKQITPQNVGRLKPAWTYRYGAGTSDLGDMGLDYRFEVTPLMIGGVMYISTPGSSRVPALKSTVTALNPETGKVIWKYESPRNIHGRGLAYWPGDEKTAPRLYFGTRDGFLMAVDMTTGVLAPGFGNNGLIDAYIGVASEIVGESRRSTWTIPNPVTIYKGLVITGARPAEAGPPGPRGDIRAWDARTGRLVWTFHTVPQPGEPNFETYTGEEWRDRSGANVWATMSLDEENGILYAPLGDLNGRAKGPELYSSSLVALDANTGKLKWFRQISHKDMWDWDLPVPPVLLSLKKDGKAVPAVLQVGKHSLLFLFNRLTGEPINGFEERPTPRSDIPGDDAWPTQPFPTKPGPLARTSMRRDEIPKVLPEMAKYCTDFWDKNQIKSPGLYGRPLMKSPTVTYPSATGGPNWGGGSYNPVLGLYFINVQNRATFHPAGPQLPFGQLPPRAPGSSAAPGAVSDSGNPPPAASAAASPPAPPPPPAAAAPGFPAELAKLPQSGFNFRVNPSTTLSCGATPWGELVAVDLNTEEIAWRVPLGMIEALGEKGASSGGPNLGGNITTASGLVFIAASNDRRIRAFDAKTGAKLWEAELEASGHSTPITYMGRGGKQYVVIAAAGGTTAGGPRMSDTLAAFALP